jgi:F0F1-type ATP synthase membrane subunit b/b'
MEIIPDPIHVLLLTLPFIVAAGSLHFILWQPLLAWLDEREATSSKARHEAHELEGAAAEQLSRIEARLAEARNHVATLRQQARVRALATEAELVAGARAQADQRVTEALAQIVTDKQAASVGLGASAADLSRDIAIQVLGRDPGASAPPGSTSVGAP